MKNTQRHKFAFTVPEVLVVVAIIGITAAITIPIISKDYKEKTYNSARLKALATFGEAGKMAALYDFDKPQTSAKNFVNNILSKNLKIIRVCDTAAECDFTSQIQPSNPASNKLVSDDLKNWGDLGYNDTYAGSPLSNSSMSTYVKTVGGYSAKVFYNPRCGKNPRQISDLDCTSNECPYYSSDAACMNVVYDMNGRQAPNHVGYDIGFVTTFWSGANTVSVAPGILPYSEVRAIYDKGYQNWSGAQNLCASRGTSKISYSVPDFYELQSISINQFLASMPVDDGHWSATPVTNQPGNAWFVNPDGSYIDIYEVEGNSGVWCVRR